MKVPALVSIVTVLVALLPSARAETVADRQGAVLKDRATLENDPRWIYNDFEKGFAEGNRTGKPVLIVLRCIPCLACAGIDARVLLENSELSPLLDRFVCVRVINANALDLTRFQFDFDLSFSTLIFNGDGTLYGRYGSWTHQKDPREEATDGFRRTLEAALALHEGYPGNRASLLGKQPKPSAYKTPVDMPTLNGKYTRNLDWENKVVASCVHCHQIGDALRAAHRERKEKIPANLVYPFPAPETIGLTLGFDHAARIKSVTDGSPASGAALRSGDDLISLGGQPLISMADVSWVLHHAPDTGTLAAIVQRGQERLNVSLTLPAGWRNHSDISRRVGTWGMRSMALGGLLLEEVNAEERERRGLKSDQLALVAKHVGEYGEHAAAKKAGFLKDDILIEMGGNSSRRTESELIGEMLARFQPGEKVTAVILRGTERIEVSLPMQ